MPPLQGFRALSLPLHNELPGSRVAARIETREVDARVQGAQVELVVSSGQSVRNRTGENLTAPGVEDANCERGFLTPLA